MNNPIKTYIINFFVPNLSHEELGVVLSKINSFVQRDTSVRAYWNYIPLVYCVKSSSTSTELAARISALLPTAQVFVAELNAENIDGQLPKDAWTWFYAAPPPSRLDWDLPPFNLLAGFGDDNSPPTGSLLKAPFSPPPGKD